MLNPVFRKKNSASAAANNKTVNLLCDACQANVNKAMAELAPDQDWRHFTGLLHSEPAESEPEASGNGKLSHEQRSILEELAALRQQVQRLAPPEQSCDAVNLGMCMAVDISSLDNITFVSEYAKSLNSV